MHTAKKAFAVHIHTAKVALLCTARLWQFCCSIFAVRGEVEAHGKEETLPCGMGAEHTAKPAARQTLKARQPHSHGNAVPAHGKASAHGKGLCRASSARRTAKTALPGGSLPSNLCRASPLGKGFAERIWAFTVRFGCTATPCSAVVKRIRSTTPPHQSAVAPSLIDVSFATYRKLLLLLFNFDL
jgi:hypothetical protein